MNSLKAPNSSTDSCQIRHTHIFLPQVQTDSIAFAKGLKVNRVLLLFIQITTSYLYLQGLPCGRFGHLVGFFLLKFHWGEVQYMFSIVMMECEDDCVNTDWLFGWHFWLSREEVPCQGMSHTSNKHTSVWQGQTEEDDRSCHFRKHYLVWCVLEILGGRI